jgi:hypothetical protein
MGLVGCLVLGSGVGVCVCVCVCVCLWVGVGVCCRCYTGSRSENLFEPLLAV